MIEMIEIAMVFFGMSVGYALGVAAELHRSKYTPVHWALLWTIGAGLLFMGTLS